MLLHEMASLRGMTAIVGRRRDVARFRIQDASASRVGALVSREHFCKAGSYLDHIADEMRQPAAGGTVEDDAFVAPTLVDGVTRDSPLFKEEGPLSSVTTFEDMVEAIALANDTSYGLAASVSMGNLKTALRVCEIWAGNVTVNCLGRGDVTTPLGGRDTWVFAHDQYTALRTIRIDTSDRSVDESLR